MYGEMSLQTKVLESNTIKENVIANKIINWKEK